MTTLYTAHRGSVIRRFGDLRPSFVSRYRFVNSLFTGRVDHTLIKMIDRRRCHSLNVLRDNEQVLSFRRNPALAVSAKLQIDQLRSIKLHTAKRPGRREMRGYCVIVQMHVQQCSRGIQTGPTRRESNGVGMLQSDE